MFLLCHMFRVSPDKLPLHKNVRDKLGLVICPHIVHQCLKKVIATLYGVCNMFQMIGMYITNSWALT